MKWQWVFKILSTWWVHSRSILWFILKFKYSSRNVATKYIIKIIMLYNRYWNRCFKHFGIKTLQRESPHLSTRSFGWRRDPSASTPSFGCCRMNVACIKYMRSHMDSLFYCLLVDASVRTTTRQISHPYSRAPPFSHCRSRTDAITNS